MSVVGGRQPRATDQSTVADSAGSIAAVEEGSASIVPIDPLADDQPSWLDDIATAILQGHRCVVLAEDQQAEYHVWQTLKQPYQGLTRQGIVLYSIEPLKDGENQVVVCPREQALRWELTAEGELQLVDADGSLVAAGPATAGLTTITESLARWRPDDHLVMTADGDTQEYASRDACRQDWTPVRRPHVPVKYQYLDAVDLLTYSSAELRPHQQTPDWVTDGRAQLAEAVAAFTDLALVPSESEIPYQEFKSRLSDWYRGLTGDSPPSDIEINQSLPSDLTKARGGNDGKRRYLTGVTWRLPHDILHR